MNKLIEAYGVDVCRLKELLTYDPETGLFHRRVNRGPGKAGDLAGNRNKGGYHVLKIDGRDYYAHRLAWLYVYGVWPSHTIDHKNQIRNDNRIENLRDVPHLHNMHNLPVHNLPGTGVQFRASMQKYLAKIRAAGKVIYLGAFTERTEAEAAYRKAKRELQEGTLP